jgi:hypothetical protein
MEETMMGKPVEIKIINKQPPAGRCRIYMDMAMVLMEAYRNVRMVTVPNDQRGPDDPAPAAVLVDNHLMEPEDTVIVSGREFIKAVEGAGGILYESTEPPLEKLDAVIEGYSKPPG